jgi:hypothetical protein
VLVQKLGSDDFLTREKAQVLLAAHVPASIPAITKGTKSEDPEVTARCVALLKKWLWDTAEKKVESLQVSIWKQHKLPWIDGLPPDYPDRDDIMEYYLDVADSLIGRQRCAPDYPSYRLATKIYLLDLFKAGAGEQKVQKLIDAMALRDVQWIETYGVASSPEVPMPVLTMPEVP